MSLMRREPVRAWDPFRELEDMSARINRFFSRPFGIEGAPRGYDFTPSMNISETDKAYVVEAELPGVKKEDVHVSVDSGVLTISGERRHELEDKTARRHRVECAYGSFMRRLALPEDVSTDDIEASYRDGMLTVKLNKLAPESRPSTKEIPIN